MKSPMVENASYIKDEDRSHYTDLQVLRSGAGWYVGTLFWDAEYEFWDAGSRDSDYFGSKEEAERFLEVVSGVGLPGCLREHP